MGTEYYDLGIEPLIDGKIFPAHGEEEAYETLKKQMMEYRENETLLEISFSSAAPNGDLKITSDGWQIIMKNAECRTLGDGIKEYNPTKRNFMVERTYQVVVDEIDEAEGIIYVSHAKASRLLRAYTVSQLRKELRKQRRTKAQDRKDIVLPARVISVNDEEGYVRVDIMGYHISGIITRKEWSYHMKDEEKLTDLVQIGSKIDVLVYRYDVFEKNRNVFYCSNRRLAEDPWVGLERRIATGDVVVVKCDKLANHAFIGHIEGERVPVLGIYPIFQQQGIADEIKVGRSYRCKVLSRDSRGHMLKVNVIKVCKERQKKGIQVSNIKKDSNVAKISEKKLNEEAALATKEEQEIVSEIRDESDGKEMIQENVVQENFEETDIVEETTIIVEQDAMDVQEKVTKE